MAEHRPFPPSTRRRSLARRAGLHAASPLLVGAAAGAGALVALAAIGGTLADRLGAAVAAACSGRMALGPAALPDAVAGAALPVAAAAALAAAAAHLLQTRGVWLPRRRLPGAPVPEAGPWPRTRRAATDLAAAAAIGGVAFAWLWMSASRIATLTQLAPISAPLAGHAQLAPSAAPLAAHAQLEQAGMARLFAGTSALLASLFAALVVAWAACGVLDALLRRAALARALAMTAAEHREDARLAGADPRWRAHRRAMGRAMGRAMDRGPSPADAVAGAALLLLGDGSAVAIAWDPPRRPLPVRTATGQGPLATQLLGLARRYRIAVHRDPPLAAALVHGDGPIPEPHWPRLAEIIAATRGRDRTTPR